MNDQYEEYNEYDDDELLLPQEEMDFERNLSLEVFIRDLHQMGCGQIIQLVRNLYQDLRIQSEEILDLSGKLDDGFDTLNQAELTEAAIDFYDNYLENVATIEGLHERLMQKYEKEDAEIAAVEAVDRLVEEAFENE